MGPLYPHQEELLGRVRQKFGFGLRRVLIQGATGIGKNHMFGHVVLERVAEGERVVFAAHLDALLDDLADRLAANGIPFGFLQGDRPTRPEAPVQIVSVQTIHARAARPPATLLILDEAHRAVAPTVRAFIEAYPEAQWLGGTATPQRPDETPLGSVFDAMVCGPSVRWLTEKGFLVPCNVIGPAAPVDGALAADPVDAWFEHARGRRTIVFARSVHHAEDIAARFNLPLGSACRVSHHGRNQSSRSSRPTRPPHVGRIARSGFGLGLPGGIRRSLHRVRDPRASLPLVRRVSAGDRPGTAALGIEVGLSRP